MHKIILSLLVVLCARAALAAAPAESDLRRRGHLVLSADRLMPLFGYDREQVTTTNPFTTITDTASQSSFSLLWGGGSGLRSGVRPFTSPRVGVDYTIAEGLTVGGSLAWTTTLGGTTSTDRQTGATTTSTSVDTPSFSVFGLAPRVGYVFDLRDRISLWPRAGLSYYWGGTTTHEPGSSNRTEISYSLWALDLEAMFAYMPAPHVAILGGPVLDLPLSGSAKDTTVAGGTSTTTSSDFSSLHFGLTLGLAVYL